jgi:AraC family transcriptional activator of pobA
MDAVPTYALYGESDENLHEHWLHCESIMARSRLFDWTIEPHRHHRFLQILHLRSGEVEVSLEGGGFVGTPPLVIVVPPRTVHGYRFSEDVQGHVVTLAVDRVERMLESCPEVADLLREPRVLGLSDAHAGAIDAHVAVVAGEFAGSAAWRSALIEAHLRIVLVEVARLIGAASAEGEAGRGRHDRRASAFRGLVDRDFRQHHGVASYADRLGISQTHLNRLCRAAFNESALGLINRRVILEATRDLTFTVMPVKEIAVSLGFDDPAYFTRFFTRQVGVSPSRFRARQLGGSGPVGDSPAADPAAPADPSRRG